MFIKILFNYLLGYLNITIEGFFVERFINILASKKIFLWNVKKKNSSLLCANISIKDFKEIKDIARKTKCKVKINKKKGVPFVFNKYKKRKIFIILLLPIIIMIMISSMYVWNIDIVSSGDINEKELLEQLNEKGLAVGKIKRNVDTKNIITNIRLERSDISWMEINLKGTNAIVNIVKAEEKPNIIDDNEYCDIVSDKKGIITKITAQRGTIAVKVGDIVEEGTKLISGIMEGKYTDPRYVHAKGEVEAKVWYTKRRKSKFTREVSKQTGAEKEKYSIIFNNFRINLYKSLPNFEKYDTISENKKIKLFSDFYLPISIQKDTYKEIKTNDITYGKQELQNILISEMEKEFEQENFNDKNITNKTVNVYQKDKDTIEVELTYEVLETIGTEEKIVKE